MPQAISGPVGPWTDHVVIRKGGNKADDVRAVQELLSRASMLTGDPKLNPGPINGEIPRGTETKSATLEAIGVFQADLVKRGVLRGVDRRVDEGGTTWSELVEFVEVDQPQGPPFLIQYQGKVVPFFTQFDKAWGGNKLGKKKTLGQAGCAITSIAMILKFYGREIDPGSLDEHLDANNGYSGDNVYWAKAFEAGEVAGKPTLKLTDHQFKSTKQFDAKVHERLGRHWPTLAHIDYGQDAGLRGDHWVVIVGSTPGGDFIINDPGTSRGNGAGNPWNRTTILQQSRRKGGLNLVRLCLFDVQGA